MSGAGAGRGRTEGGAVVLDGTDLKSRAPVSFVWGGGGGERGLPTGCSGRQDQVGEIT